LSQPEGQDGKFSNNIFSLPLVLRFWIRALQAWSNCYVIELNLRTNNTLWRNLFRLKKKSSSGWRGSYSSPKKKKDKYK
jgi:hypothetical protein